MRGRCPDTNWFQILVDKMDGWWAWLIEMMMEYYTLRRRLSGGGVRYTHSPQNQIAGWQYQRQQKNINNNSHAKLQVGLVWLIWLVDWWRRCWWWWWPECNLRSRSSKAAASATGDKLGQKQKMLCRTKAIGESRWRVHLQNVGAVVSELWAEHFSEPKNQSTSSTQRTKEWTRTEKRFKINASLRMTFRFSARKAKQAWTVYAT